VWEWEVLNERFKSDTPNEFGQYTKLRLIIPPKVFIAKQRQHIQEAGQVIIGGDALSEHFITGKIPDTTDLLTCEKDKIEKQKLNEEYVRAIEKLNSYVNDENCNVIVCENPPYRDITSNTSGIATKGFTNYVKEQMKKEEKGAKLNDLSNLFIWSAFKFYLKKENDYLIVYSPVKYFKSLNLCNKKFINGYALNRGFFGQAGESVVSLIEWQNINKIKNKENYELQIIDIVNGKRNENEKNISVRKVLKTFADDEKLWDKRKDKSIACINLSGFNLDSNSVMLHTTRREIKGHGSCFYLQSDNFITKLPLFCAKLYPQEKWYERDVYFTTADKGEEYVADKQFLKSCLIYTCLTNRNKCRSFKGNDDRDYYNELCLLQDALSDREIALKYNETTKVYEAKDEYKLNGVDQDILYRWQLVLDEAKQLEPSLSKWGLYQIEQELLDKKKSDKKDTKTNIKNETTDDFYYGETEQEITKTDKTSKKDCSNLAQYIKELKESLKLYYKSEIQNNLFKYELLK
jgi:hypothetical protein